MTAAKLIALGVQISMAIIVFCVALRAHTQYMADLLRNPSLLLRSLLAMNVLLPVIVAGLCAVFALHLPIEVALIVLALSPVPPIVPTKEFKAGGRESYVLGMLALSALLAIVTVPLGVVIISRLFNHPTSVTPATIAYVVGTSVLLPLLAGFVVKWLAPNIAARIARPLSLVAMGLLVICFVPVLIASWHAMVALIGNFTLVAIVVFVIIGLALGHWLGGPDPNDRTVLAISTASRHPGVALAVAHAVAPDDKSIPAAILLAFLVSTIATIPYVKRRSRLHAEVGTL
jgi:BASS family bile acid:Na+ symporter